MRQAAAVALAAWSVVGLVQFTQAEAPKNVILFIGDGMGLEQVKAAGMYENGAAGTLNFEQFANQALVSTYNASGTMPDSAAAGTAIATGYKADNGVISIATPGDGSNRLTLLEYFKNQGKSTGLITTDVMTGATPATFGAHDPSRNNTAAIADDYVNSTTGSRPNVLLGGGTIASATGYTVVTDTTSLNNSTETATGHLSGQFGTGQFGYVYDNASYYSTNPYLWQMTSKAINQLSGNNTGFFLMVEQALIDKSGTNTNRNVTEVLELEKAVQQAINYASTRTDTLVIVTADHETGGMKVTQNNGAGSFPTVTWSTVASGSHSTAPVQVYAFGANAQMISRTLDNTDFFKIATDSNPAPTLTRKFQQGVNSYSGTHDTMLRQDQADTSFASTTTLVSDLDDNAATGNQPAQALLRFDALFGTSANQIPLGSKIYAAKLLVMTGTGTNDGTATTVSAYRMLQNWSDSATWNSLGGGVNPDGLMALSLADNSIAPSYNNNGVYAIFDVTSSVQAWSDGANNYGFALLANGTDGWRFASSESTSGTAPILEITLVPEPGMLTLLATGSLTLLTHRHRGRHAPVASQRK